MVENAVAQAKITPALFSKADGRKIKFARGQFIFHQGDPSDGVYFITAGRVRLLTLTPLGKEATVALLGPNELFGEECLLFGRQRRIMAAVSLSATEVVKVGVKIIKAQLGDDAQLANFVLTHVVRRMQKYEQALVHQIVNNTERRLARALLSLAYHDYAPTANAKPIVLQAVSQELLAKIVGASRPRINEFMNKFRRLGYIDYTGRRITVKPSLVSILFQIPQSTAE